MQPLTNSQETGDQPIRNSTTSFPSPGPTLECQLPSLPPWTKPVAAPVPRAKRKGNPSPPSVGYSLGCPLLSPPETRQPQHGICNGAGPSHFPPPSPKNTVNSRLPAEGGRSAGWLPAPPPAGAKPTLTQACAVHRSPEGSHPHPRPHLGETEALSARGVGHPLPPPPARRGGKIFSLATTPLQVGQGQRHSQTP